MPNNLNPAMIVPANSCDLPLGDDDSHPRRLVPIPSSSINSNNNNNNNNNTTSMVLAYGGDDGTLALNDNISDSKSKWRKERQFDDAVRAVAFSPEGDRVAVGFEEGYTQIFVYDTNNDMSSHENDETAPKRHEFFQTSSSETTMDGEDDMYDQLLTQSDAIDAVTTTTSHERSFSGPRFSVPIRDLQFHPHQKHTLAIASEDSSGFCIVNVSSEQSLQEKGRWLEQEATTHHQGSGVRSLAFHPQQGKLLASLGMDGRLCLWKTYKSDTPEVDWELKHEDKVCCVTKKDVGELLGSDCMDRSCAPVWSKEGDYLALPGMVDVQLRHESDWRKQLFVSSVADEGHSDAIVRMAWGEQHGTRLLITSGRDKRVVLWQIFHKEDSSSRPGRFLSEIKFDSSPLSTFPSPPTDLLFFQEWKQLYVCLETGALMAYSTNDFPTEPAAAALEDSPIDEEESELEYSAPLNTQPNLDVIAKDTSFSKDTTTAKTIATTLHKPKMKRLAKSSRNDSDDDDDDDDVFRNPNENETTTETKKSTSFKSPFIADEAEEGSQAEEDNDNDHDYDDINVKAPEKAEAALTEYDDADNISFTDQFEAPDDASMLLPGEQRSSSLSRLRSSYVSSSAPEPQPPFSPSATPLHQDISRRILCWNHIGTVTHRRESHDENVVDINFIDAAVRRPISFPESYGFIIGTLGEDGGMFATDLEDDDDDDYDYNDHDEWKGFQMSDRVKKIIRQKKDKAGSRVFFHRYDTFGALKEKDWSLALPSGERVLGCACGSGWASVVTSKRYLRLFSSSGAQSNILWLPGKPVTMFGRERFLCVIYHINAPLADSTQQLGYMLLDPMSGITLSNGPMTALCYGANLTWAGFSEDLCPYVMDSLGMLSVLNNTHGWHWSPILDTNERKKSKEDHFWPVTVMNGKLVCVPLKGGNEYPDAARRPITSSLALKVPLVRGILGANSFILEETSVRAAMSLKQKRILNDLEVSENPEAEDNIEDEYDRYCTAVDKVTLKLFFEAIGRGKVEFALDLVERLHKEKSYEVALKASDQCNRLKLSDEIAVLKDRKFPMVEDEFNELDHNSSPFDVDTYQSDIESQSIIQSESRNISPDEKATMNNKNTSKRVREKDSIHDNDDVTDDDSSSDAAVPPTTKMLKINTTAPKRKNPFAKNRMESPAKHSPPKAKLKMSEKAQVSLSRLSTFSAQARSETKSRKTII